ncbi:MAG: DMT family transporter [Pseudomonadota bacterium]
MTNGRLRDGLLNRGVLAALAAAALFGLGTPLAKQLVSDVNPWLLAGLLYAGSGIGLTAARLFRPAARVHLTPPDRWYLAGAIASGGVAAPALLMTALVSMPAAGASLLLNAEGVFTALLAWFVFRENVDRRVALGMLTIVAGVVVLSWNSHANLQGVRPSLLVLAACLAWAVDNNFTRKLSLHDATWLASVKGLAAGATNLLIATAAGAAWPSIGATSAALVIGSFAYGVSLVLFVVGLRHLGAARTTAYFSTAPFVGALVSFIWLGEPITIQVALAGALMGVGVWLHLTERHEHAHLHAAIEHSHEHEHDEHHDHAHSPETPAAARHTHRHRHEPQTHSHAHFPDAHHQHEHK